MGDEIAIVNYFVWVGSTPIPSLRYLHAPPQTRKYYWEISKNSLTVCPIVDIISRQFMEVYRSGPQPSEANVDRNVERLLDCTT